MSAFQAEYPPAGSPQAAAAYLGALMDGLAGAGVRHLIFCPGSRSTPVLLAAHAQGRLRLWQHVDERSAAFFALGMAKVSGDPVALLATSGTAAANFLPAVVEARYSRAPLILLTADRPRELREVGAAQTIDQVGLYGSHVKWSVDLPLPEASLRMVRHALATAARAAALAREAPAGPVHLNLPLREPLIPPELLQAHGGISDRAGAPAAEEPARPPLPRVTAGRLLLDDEALAALAGELRRVKRGLVVVGPQEDAGLLEPVLRLAGVLGWPVLADPLSQLRRRRPEAVGDVPVITAYDAFLRIPEARERLAPDGILRLGAAPVSKALNQYLERYQDVPQWVVDQAPGWRDPAQVASQILWAEPGLLVEALARACRGGSHDEAWLALWRGLEETSARVLAGAGTLEAPGGLFEGRVLTELLPLLPDDGLLVVGNSMPVRDLDTFHRGQTGARILGNRGASGIDGVVSTALGAAAVWPGPAVLVVGDLSFYHDLNGLLAARLHGLRLTVVLVHNDGGGIFSFLPQAELGPLFEPYWGTPTGLDFAPAVAMYGGRWLPATDWDRFREAVAAGIQGDGLTVVEVRSDRARNAELHRALWDRVARAVRPLLEEAP
ncbi:MAG TPA: 2-succinyl-5-enolpyruvyl-6-hydroxy-3-cyclohexene-1-carboxylic-acid synthase [Limnochorda sp.]